MATSYPDGLDNFTNPTASDTLDSATVPHATQHANTNDAIEAIEAELGTTPKGSKASVKARLDSVDANAITTSLPPPSPLTQRIHQPQPWASCIGMAVAPSILAYSVAMYLQHSVKIFSLM